MNIIIRLLLLALVLAFPVAAQAQVKRPPLTGNIVNDIEAATSGPRPKLTGNAVIDLTAALDAKLLPDLTYALKLATASNSQVTAPCYQAWIDIITTRQKAVQDDKGEPIPLPAPHLITDFEKLVEMRNALQPESQFMMKCSPVASMVKKDIAGFMGVVISGGAGLAMLVPGL